MKPETKQDKLDNLARNTAIELLELNLDIENNRCDRIDFDKYINDSIHGSMIVENDIDWTLVINQIQDQYEWLTKTVNNKYKIIFNGRKFGAIGEFSPIIAFTEGYNEADVKNRLFEESSYEIEHIIKIEEEGK